MSKKNNKTKQKALTDQCMSQSETLSTNLVYSEILEIPKLSIFLNDPQLLIILVSNPTHIFVIPLSELRKDMVVWWVTATQLSCNYKGKQLIKTNWIYLDFTSQVDVIIHIERSQRHVTHTLCLFTAEPLSRVKTKHLEDFVIRALWCQYTDRDIT